jgi:tetratricopeptide (TPR) repeat protein
VVLLPVAAQPEQVARSFANLRLASQQDRPQDEARELETILSLEPWRTGLWEKLGAARQASGELDQAIEAYQKALMAGKLSIEGQFALGDAFLLSDRPEQARDTWANLLQQPLDEDQYRRLYENQSQHGEPAAVLEVLSRWIEKHPENGNALYYQGLYLSLQQPAEAIRSLQAAARFDPTYNTPVSLLLPALRAAAGADDEAYRQVLTGRGLGQVGEWSLAERAFGEAVRIQPGVGRGVGLRR